MAQVYFRIARIVAKMEKVTCWEISVNLIVNSRFIRIFDGQAPDINFPGKIQTI
jgi:hypothetical protein